MEWADFLDNYGLPIAMLVALAVGRFVPGFVYTERKKEVEEAHTEIKRLNDFVISEVSPALTRQAEVVEQAMNLLAEVQTEKLMEEREERVRVQERQRLEEERYQGRSRVGEDQYQGRSQAEEDRFQGDRPRILPLPDGQGE